MEYLAFYEDPLEIIERMLRDVIHDVLSIKYGPNWHQVENISLGSEWVKRLEKKQKADEGILKSEIAYDLPIAYAEFSDLGKLFTKHREKFTTVFKDWDTFMAYYHTAEKLRNTVKHHRDLNPTQYHLLDGIAGEIENTVIYWKIGTKLILKKSSFQFIDLLAIERKSEAEIISESVKCVSAWKNRFLKAAESSGLLPEKFRIEESEYRSKLQSQQLIMEIHTSPEAKENYRIDDKPYKGIYGELIVNSDFGANLDALLSSMGRAYFHIAYDLDENINVEVLSKWSLERAGLNPASSGSFNQELTDIEYSLLGGKIRVGAWKYAESIGREGGRLFATTGSQEPFWRAHIFLDPRKLLGFMVGSITPKAMMHLVRLSQIPIQNSES